MLDADGKAYENDPELDLIGLAGRMVCVVFTNYFHEFLSLPGYLLLE